MPFSLSAKPPKPKPKKAKEKVIVRSSGRGGSGNIKKKKVPKTPPSGADLISIASVSGNATSPVPNTDATSSQLSRITSAITSTSKTHSSNSADMGEAEDAIRAPVGREILSAKHRKIYSGRGGAGNAHKLLADDSVYERVLLHEQGIVQAYNEERREREARSTGRGGSGNIRKKKSAYGSDTSSTRTRSSGKSWGSIGRRYRHASGHGTNTQSSLSLSPIPSLQGLPNNDFGSPLDKGIFEKVLEEDESQASGPSSAAHLQANKAGGRTHLTPLQINISNEMDMLFVSTTANVATASTSSPASTRPTLFTRTPASKPISPSAISSSSWIANRLQEPPSLGGLSLTRSTHTPPPASTSYLNGTGYGSGGSSSSSIAARGKSVPPNSRFASPIPPSSSPPVLNITISPSTTPTMASSIRRAASSNALNNVPVEMSEDQMATVRPRQAPAMSSQAHRNMSIYKSHDSLSSSASEDPIALYAAYSEESLDSTLPYLNPSTPTAASMRYPAQQRPPSRPLPHSPSPTNSNTLEPPVSAADAARHSRQMSSSSTSGSDLDLSRYNFPDAPLNEPVILPREAEPARLHMIMETAGDQGMMMRRPSEPPSRLPLPPPPQDLPPPPARLSRAPVQPGAYQAALRSVLDDVPDGPPPIYQPRASRRYPVDQDYSEPPTPTQYSPYRIASPNGKAPMRSTLDTSSATLRPQPRATMPTSPLSEVYTPMDGTPLERYPPLNEKSYPNEKAQSSLHRAGSGGRRPSDPYQRLLAAAAKNSPPGTPPRRASSSNQTLSPHLTPNHHLTIDQAESPTEYSDPRSRPISGAFSTYTRGTRQSMWGASQATATAVDHHEMDFPNMEEDDGTYYSSMFGDIDGYNNERGRAYKEILVTKNMRNGKEPDWLPPVPQMPKHLLVATRADTIPEPAASRSPSRQLPTPPLGPAVTPPPGQTHPHFPGGMGWDELNRPVPRKLSKMEKALLRRVEFGAVAAADIASIPLA